MNARLPVYDAERLDAACRDLDLKLVVLFGSRATGSPPPTAESDLDLAVWTGAPNARERFWTLHRALAEAFAGHVLDLVVLDTTDPLFRHEIMRAGVLLWGDQDRFFDYRAYAYRAFVDSADLRALEDALFRKKMAYIRRTLHGAS